MRRGLIAWSKEEVPSATLDRRVSRLQAAMREEGLDAVLAYTSFAQPGAVQWLTHFVPYWSEALAVVPLSGMPTLLASLTPRVHPWIREVSHLAEVRSAPKLGDATVAFLRELHDGAKRVGVIGLDTLPWSVGAPLYRALGADKFCDASALYASIRQPADAEEVALASVAAGIARDAIAAIPVDAKTVAHVLSAVEYAARCGGAEEVLLRCAPDYRKGTALRRIEGDAVLGERYALEVTIAYKGAWVRVNHCDIARGGGARPQSWHDAQAWFSAQLARFDPHAPAMTPPADGIPMSWTFETCTGVYPLSVVSSHDRPPASVIANGTLGTLSIECELPDGPWRASAPVVLGHGDITAGSKV
ncbi:hypothetical protein P3T18_000517 [Paraburkholderia sp. GAS199]|uniref:aminopeptidase P family N-terminal domain-containing protein n=1 Tax=Paraburkholderia sp. GAS199 TaxID=3035126 RepID=UPI003D1E392A